MDKVYLLLLSPFDADIQRVEWCIVASKKSSKKNVADTVIENISGSGVIDEFLGIYRERFSNIEVTVIISGEHLTYTDVALAVKNQRQMLQALPFLVEEQVIGNIEDMHIAASERLDGDTIRIAIIDKAYLDKLKALFAHHKILIREIFGLPDLLVCAEGEMQILLNDDFALIKGANNCFQCDQASLEPVLQLVAWENISVITISLHELNKRSLALAKRIKTRFGSDTLKIKSAVFTEELLDYIIRTGKTNTNSSLNILQGDLSALNGRSQKLQQLLPLAWVAVLCVFIQIAFNIVSGLYFSRLSENTKESNAVMYLQLFPEDKKVVDVASQLNAKMNSSSFGLKSSRFPVVFASTIKAMSGVGNRNDIKLKQFRYDETSGELKVGVDTSSIALLDKIKNKLAESNLIVEIISANEENGVIKATLSIKYA